MWPVIEGDRRDGLCLPLANSCEWRVSELRQRLPNINKCIDITGREFDSFYITIKELLWLLNTNDGNGQSVLKSPLGFKIFLVLIYAMR